MNRADGRAGPMPGPRVILGRNGQTQGVEETTSSAEPSPSGPGHPATEPEVTHVLDRDVARLTLTGELTGAIRRPLMRVLTDLLLQVQSLHRVEIELHGVTFMNSAGLAVLVQALRMTAPRGIGLVLVRPTPAVLRPLQLSGLWHRFTMVDAPTESSGGD